MSPRDDSKTEFRFVKETSFGAFPDSPVFSVPHPPVIDNISEDSASMELTLLNTTPVAIKNALDSDKKLQSMVENCVVCSLTEPDIRIDCNINRWLTDNTNNIIADVILHIKGEKDSDSYHPQDHNFFLDRVINAIMSTSWIIESGGREGGLGFSGFILDNFNLEYDRRIIFTAKVAHHTINQACHDM